MGGVPILSVAEYLIRHRCVLAADVLVTASANDTALGPPIYWCPFFVVGVIGHAHPILADGLHKYGGVDTGGVAFSLCGV